MTDPGKFVSYASNFEDILLRRVFSQVQNGFYIDIGADHPVIASTTKAFYDRGWSGINVEPGPRWNLLDAERPRDINLNIAVTDLDGEVDFFLNEGLSSISSIFPEMNDLVRERTNRRIRYRVPALTLNTVVSRYAKERHVHFLKIDAEGAEERIITSTDWSAIRPVVLVVESTEPFTTKRIDKSWNDLLRTNGYAEAYFDGVNTWFVRNENAELLDHFKTPVNVLDNFTIFDPKRGRGILDKLRKSLADRLRKFQSLGK